MGKVCHTGCGKVGASSARWQKAQEYERAWWAKAAEAYRRDSTGGRHFVWRASELEKLIGNLLDEERRSSARVLEVGSGPIGIVSALRWGERYAIDPLDDFYRSEPSFASRRDPSVRFARGVGEHLPFGDGFFSLVLCDNVLDHCQAPARVLDEIHRVLSDDGALYLAVNVHTELGASLRRLLSKLEIDKGHPWTFTLESLRGFVCTHGFTRRAESIQDYREARAEDRRAGSLKMKMKGYSGLSEFLYRSVWSKTV